MLVDCGSGIASELRAHDPGPLTDIVISHFHADHWFDLVPLHYAYRYGSWSDRPRASLHLPPGGRSVLDTVAAVWDGSVETFEAAWNVEEYDPQLDLRLGDLRFSFAPSLHYTTCYSIKIDAGGSTIAYSADTAPTERLARFAHGADLFLCEASLKDANGRLDGARPHGRDGGGPRGRQGRRRAGCCSPTCPAENGSDEVIEMAAAGVLRPGRDRPPGPAHRGLRQQSVQAPLFS